jgi:glycosyltransferase involved in cell wall biosynthesis
VNILLTGIFYNGHGFAEGNRVLLNILDRAGFRIRIEPLDMNEKYSVLPDAEIRYISSFEQTELSSNDIYICNWIGPEVKVNPDFRVNIVRTTFETDRIPEQWVPKLNQFDEVWVQSKFNEQTFRGSGVTVPLRLVPNFFDLSQYKPHGEKLELPVDKSFLLLSVFDMQVRKGFDILLNAYLSEFTADDDIALVMKIRDTSRVNWLEQVIREHPKSASDRPVVYLIDEMLEIPTLMALYRTCHAFVLPTRGEGWGRPFFEAMLMELPVIGTAWSGQMEFMNAGNSFPVRIDRFEKISNNEFEMFDGHYWAKPSLEDLRKKMRYVYNNQKLAKSVGKYARLNLLTRFDIERTMEIVIQAIQKYGGEISFR